MASLVSLFDIAITLRYCPVACNSCCLDGEWIKCDEVSVGFKGQSDFMESTHFLIGTATPLSLLVRLVIKIEGKHKVFECRVTHFQAQSV